MKSLLGLIFIGLAFASCHEEESPVKQIPYTLIKSFGQEGTAPDQFSFVPLISIDKDDILYLSDVTQYNIKKYSTDGDYLGLYKTGVDSQAPIFINNKSVFNNNDNLIIETGGNQITNTTGLNIVGQMTNDADNIYLATNYTPSEGYNQHRIYKYDLAGNFVTSWGTKGDGEGQINEPWGVSLFGQYIVVTCQLNIRAQFFSKDGTFIKALNFSDIASALYGNFVKGDYLYIAAGNFIIKTDFNGDVIEKIGEGDLMDATSVVIDSKNHIIVTDIGDSKIKVFTNKDSN